MSPRWPWRWPRRGHDVTVYTRRDDARPAGRGCRSVRGVDGACTCRPDRPRRLPKDELLPHMAGFGRRLRRLGLAPAPPDVVHAHFWMSGLAALDAAEPVWPCRWCRPSTRSARSSAGTRARQDTSPAERIDARARHRPRRRPGHRDLLRRGARSSAGWACRPTRVRGGAVRRGHAPVHARGPAARRRPRRPAAAAVRRPTGRAQGRRQRHPRAGRGCPASSW